MGERADMLKTCRACHGDFFAESVEHFPVKEGQCFECHDPHRSTRDHLLKTGVYDTCVACHDPPEELSQPAHGAAGVKDCIACHDPHFGAPPMLKSHPSIPIPTSLPGEKKSTSKEVER